jgi:hypothetical protein
MGISIEDIKALLDGKEKLSEVVNRNVVRIEEQMKELQGALYISQKMQKDQKLDQEFQLDRYWNVMHEEEEHGSKFFDVVKDYMDFESDIFFGTWNTVFLTDLKGFFAGKKYVTAVIIVAFLCLIRGLAYHYLWKMGSILEGAIYPFIIFAIISILVLPLYILNKKFSEKDVENRIENETVITDTKGCLGAILNLIFAVVGALFCVLFVPLMVEKFYLNRINAGMQYVSSSPIVIPYVIVALFLFITLYWLISKQGLFTNRIKGEKTGLVCHLPKKLRILVAVVVLVCYLLTSWLYTTCYNQIDDTGFQKRRIFVTTHYQYEDVEYYQLYAKFDGTLGLFFYLKDGSKVEYYTSAVSSNIDDTENYAIKLAQKLNTLGIKCKISDEKKLYKQLSYDYWKEVAKQIISVSDVGEY